MGGAPTTYREAQLAARAAAGSLSEAAVAAIRADLKREAMRLAAQIAALPVGTPAARRAALEASAAIVKQMEARLLAASLQAVAQHRAVAFTEVAGIWQAAALETAQVRGVPNAVLGAVRQPPITLLGSYEALGGASAHWKTALQGSIQAGGADLDAILRHGISQQVSPETLARSLRAYVVGAEPFHEAFGDEAFARVQDLRQGVPAPLREAGRKMAANARRIAYSEVHNARAEAEVTHFALDPLVATVQWTLSPFRGQVTVPDVCDVLASSDWYGLGPGVYPVGKVPPPPHPYDRCERMPMIRPVSEAAAPKPYPVRTLPLGQAKIPKAFRATTTAAQAARITAQAEQVMAAAEAWAVTNPLQALVSASLEAGSGLLGAVARHAAALQKTTTAAIAALPPMPVSGPQLATVLDVAPPPVTLGTFIVPGEVAAQPGVLEQVKALIKKHHNKSPSALGQLEALGVDVTKAKAAQVAKAAKKAAAAEAKLVAAIDDEVAQLQALGLEVSVAGRTPSAGLLQQLQAARTAAQSALASGYDVAASAATMTQGMFPGASVTAFLERAYVAAGKAIDLTDLGKVAQLLTQAPSPRAGQKLVAAAKKAKASAAAKQAALTKAKAEAAELASATGVAFAEGTPLATIRAAKKVLAQLDETVAAAAQTGKAGQIAAARTVAKQKLVKLGAEPGSLAGLEAQWSAAPLGKLTPPPAVMAASNAAGPLDPAVVLAKQVGGQAGSNPGGLYLGSDGVTRYVKFYQKPAQAHGEALANTLYRDLGLRAPKSGVGTTVDGGTFFASEVLAVDGTVGSGALTPALAREILDGFAADVLTANWDAVGTGLDNVVRLTGGGVARIDQGGAFLFRAQGGLKSSVKGYGKAGLTGLSEFDSLYESNAYYRKVFTTAGLTPDTLGDTLTEAVQRITTLEQSAGGWGAYVDAMAPGMAATDRAAITEMLTARAAQLRARAKLATPGPVPVAIVPPAAPAATSVLPLPTVPKGPRSALKALEPTPLEYWQQLPAQVTPEQAKAVMNHSEVPQLLYFQSGKTSLAKVQAGIDVAAAPPAYGIQGFSLTASAGPAKHSSAIVSQFVVQPKSALFIELLDAKTEAAVQARVRTVLKEFTPDPDKLTPAQMAARLKQDGFQVVVLVDDDGIQQVIVLDAAAVKYVKAPAPIPFTKKAVSWAPDDPAEAAKAKAAAEQAERERLANLPVDPKDLEVPGLPAAPSPVTGRGKSSLGLDEAPDAAHLLSDRERRMIAAADGALEQQKAFTSLGGTRAALKDAFERAGRGGSYRGNDTQKALHNLVTELGRAVAKREGLAAAEFSQAEKLIVEMIREWSRSSDSRGAEVLKLLSERLRPGNLRTAKAGNGFFDHQERSYAAFVKSARAYLEQRLAGSGLSIEQFASAYDAYVASQRAVLRVVHPAGTLRVTRGVDKQTFFTNQGVSRSQFGSSVVVSHNSLSSFSAKSGFSGVKFSADVPVDDVEYHYLLIRRTDYWNEAEVWLIGRPRRMTISG